MINPAGSDVITLSPAQSGNRYRTLLAAVLLSISGLSHANMTVYPMSVDMAGNTEAVTLQVSSRSKATEYIRTVVKQVLHPGTPQEKEDLVKNMEGLVVSPEKFALPAGSSRVVRLIGLETPLKEKVYRVYFESVPAPDAGEDEVTPKNQVGISLVWGVLVRTLPAEPEVRLLLSQDSQTIQNTGNTHVNITKMAPCRTGCAWVSVDKNIYPGEPFVLPGTPDSHGIQIEYISSRNKPPKIISLNAGELSLLAK